MLSFSSLLFSRVNRSVSIVSGVIFPWPPFSKNELRSMQEEGTAIVVVHRRKCHRDVGFIFAVVWVIRHHRHLADACRLLHLRQL